MENKCRLRICCDDKPGIVAKISNFLVDRNANITALDQYSTDPIDGKFFLRLEFQMPDLMSAYTELKHDFNAEIATPLNMQWQLTPAATKKRLGILVSKHDHVLLELLWQWQKSELYADIPCIISNHPDLSDTAKQFNIPFHHISPQDEPQMLKLLQDNVDCVVLARYMQLLSSDFCAAFTNRIINIHHSFLPAFAGADPYQQAHDYGVKMIGATAHFVTDKLDAGPIIEQDVAHVTHKHHREELRRLGSDLERRVLARAVRWYLEDRIIPYGNKTVVFN